MQINIKACNFSLTDALRAHVEQRLHNTLTTYSAYIRRVIVRLSDINGPCGRVDRCCHLHVVLPGLPDVVVEDIEDDRYDAISRAINRAGRMVRRQLRPRPDPTPAGMEYRITPYRAADSTGDKPE